MFVYFFLFTLLGNGWSPWSHAWQDFSVTLPSEDAVTPFSSGAPFSFPLAFLTSLHFPHFPSVLHFWIIRPSGKFLLLVHGLFAEPHQICLICPYNFWLWLVICKGSIFLRSVGSLLQLSVPCRHFRACLVLRGNISICLCCSDAASVLKNCLWITFERLQPEHLSPKGNCFCCCQTAMGTASSWHPVQIVFWTIQVMQIEAENPRKGWDVVTVSQGPCLPTLLGTGVTSPVAGVLGSRLTSAVSGSSGNLCSSAMYLLSDPPPCPRGFAELSLHFRASLLVQMVKNLPAMWETWVQSLGWEDPLEEGNPLQYSCPENPHGQRSLVGYGPWDCKKSEPLSN